VDEDDKKPPAPKVSLGVEPLLIEVPVLTESDLDGLLGAIDEQHAANVRLRSKAREILRKAQAAKDRWSLPPAPALAPKEPVLRLVGKGNKNRQR
jgi:hypothetical protein